MYRLINLIKFLLLLVITSILAPSKYAYSIVLDINNNFSTNDSGALLEVSDVEGSGIRPSLKIYVMPGESKNVSKKNISGFTISRVFGAYKEKYKIICDPNANRKTKVSINYQDITEKDLPAGCEVRSKGNWTPETGNVWNKKPLKEVNYSIEIDNQAKDYFIN